MVARCTLFNISTVKTVFSLSMTVATQTAEKKSIKFVINVQLKIFNVGKLIVLTSNFYCYTALIYILCYNSGVAGQGVQGSVQGSGPPGLSKVLFESCKSD